MKKRSTSSSVKAIDPSDPALILSASERKALREMSSPKSSAPLDLQNLPFDPAEGAMQEHNQALKLREAGASAAPSPARSQ